MLRDIEKKLFDWKNSSNRKPLILRGARQVGKSFIVEKFAQEHFKKVITLNFEFRPELKQCFSSYDPEEILNRLRTMFGFDIDERHDLLFLDELQVCPQAISALRYFKEKKSHLAIIGAGSLLEFAFREEGFSMPVGRVEYLFMYPLSLGEFLDASGNNNLRAYLNERGLDNPPEDIYIQKLRDLTKLYFLLGGMPEVVSVYFKTNNIISAQNEQFALLNTYRGDFAKYSRHAQLRYLQKVFDSVPALTGQRVKYVRIDEHAQSRDLKRAVELLDMAQVISIAKYSSGIGQPLAAHCDEKKFKLFFVDIGLAFSLGGINAAEYFKENFSLIDIGARAEQFVAQQLLCNSNQHQQKRLYFWSKENSKGSAEIDFLYGYNGKVYPVEVKAGKTGTLKSLRYFMHQKNCSLGIRFWDGDLSFFDSVLSVPFYMVEHLDRLISQAEKE